MNRIPLFLLLFFLAPALLCAEECPYEEATKKAELQAYRQSMDVLAGCLENNPDDLRARFLVARILSWQGKFREAEKNYDLLLEKNPRNVDYLLGKAQVLFWMNKPEQAIPLLEKGIAIAPQYEDVWRLAIRSCIADGSKGNMDKARELIARAKERFPNTPWEYSLPTVEKSPEILAAEKNTRRDELLQEVKNLVQEKQLPAAEKRLKHHLKDDADDLEARFYYARVLTWQGKHEAALKEYDVLLQQSPDNADYLLGKGHVFFWLGRGQDALAILEKARQISPLYEEVWRAEINVLNSMDDVTSREKAEKLIADATIRFPESNFAELKRVETTASPVMDRETTKSYVYKGAELEIGGISESLNKNYRDWKSYYLDGSMKLGERKVAYGSITSTERFGLVDQEFLGGLYFPMTETLTGLVEGKTSPSHKVLPKWSLYGEVQRTLEHGFNLVAGVRHTEYTSAVTNFLKLSVERYWGSFRAAYSLYLSRVVNAGDSVSHNVQGNYFYGNANSIGLSLSSGREVERVSPTQIISPHVRTIALNGRHWFLPQWGITYELSLHDQGALYRKQGVKVGIRYLF